MRRSERNKNAQSKKWNVLYISGAIILISIIAFAISLKNYSNNLKTVKQNFDISEISQVSPNELINDISEEASTQIGKTVEESENTIINTIQETNETRQENNNLVVNTEAKVEKQEEKPDEKVEVKQEVIEEPTFTMPVEGEVTREYAKENLIYSETLQEWVTHNGIDIKAEKATVVKSAEQGTVTAIKNDPRYGITVTIEHVNGYTTRYSNLLTAEFVVVGEKVTKGQTIGTVGNTSAFEIADEPHLHFELLKDNENLDPTLYISNIE